MFFNHYGMFDSLQSHVLVTCKAPLSMSFSRQEYWRGLPFPSSGDLPDPGIEPGSPAFQADSLLSESPGGGHNGSHLAQCSTQPDRWGSFTFPVVFTYVF